MSFLFFHIHSIIISLQSFFLLLSLQEKSAVKAISLTANNFSLITCIFGIYIIFQPAKRIKTSTDNILINMTTKSKKFEKTDVSLSASLMTFQRIDEKILMYGRKMCNEFLFGILTSFLMYMIVLVQYEFESSRVSKFNLFDFSV